MNCKLCSEPQANSRGYGQNYEIEVPGAKGDWLLFNPGKGKNGAGDGI